MAKLSASIVTSAGVRSGTQACIGVLRRSSIPIEGGGARIPDYCPSERCAYVCPVGLDSPPLPKRMPRTNLESLFLAHLPAVERILNALARRHSLSADAAEEFAAWAKMRVIENDYAILAKFRGESSLPTYLTVVLSMLFREYRVQEWGRWRPSAVALRGGPLWVQLETSLDRDGLPLGQASEMLRTAGATTLSDRELAKIASQFPRRTPLRPVKAGEPPREPPGDARADDLIVREESAADAGAAQRALREGLATLSPEDSLIVRLHYMEGVSIADISRGLALPQKPLYRRVERALSDLRHVLERAGVSSEHVRALATDP